MNNKGTEFCPTNNQQHTARGGVGGRFTGGISHFAHDKGNCHCVLENVLVVTFGFDRNRIPGDEA